MIYTNLTKKAMKIACKAHEGQVDQTGTPYIFHPYHIAEQMDDEASTCVALLHDVVEDTDMTIEMLMEEFPPEVTDAVKLLTHEKGTDYYDYVRSIKQSPLAMKVKLADLEHNSDETRFTENDQVSEKTLEYFRNKYSKAKQILLEE